MKFSSRLSLAASLLLATNAAFAADVPAPVAHWTFDTEAADKSFPAEGTGVAPAIPFGSVSLMPGRFGKAVQFGADRGLVEIAQSVQDFASDAFTIMFWAQMESADEGYANFLESGAPGGIVIRSMHGTHVDVGVAGAWHAMGSRAVDRMKGDWVQIAYVFDGTKHTLYVDGAPYTAGADGADALDGKFPKFGPSIFLGGSKAASPSDIGSPLIGGIDDLRIYDKALTEEQIVAADK